MNSKQRETNRVPWKKQLASTLEVFGHRNWIIITDAAYPKHAQHGVTTIRVEADLLTVVDRALLSIKKSPHLRGKIYLDEELEFIDERDVPEIEEFRRQLTSQLDGQEVKQCKHEEILDMVLASAEHFSVLVLKTSTLRAYGSVFIELDCGYWSEKAEQRMRDNMLRPRKTKISELANDAIRAV